MTSTHRWIVTATPPTPNGDLHVGHLSGPYLAADVIARHLRVTGADVVAATGVDDHQSYTHLRALRDGVTARETAAFFGDRITEAWQRFGLDYSVIGRPDRDPEHARLTREVFSRLVKTGDIVVRERALPYCTSCDAWAFEAFVAGRCPHCGSASSGNACEVCGRPNDCADLVDPRCTVCDASCELRLCARHYFRLDRYEERLIEYWSRASVPGHLAALCWQMLQDGLPEIAVSHPASWGLPAPSEDHPGHRIYVWFEMAAGYLAAGSSEPRGGPWEDDRRIVQCFGFDNGYFHAVLFPAIMMAFDPSIPLPSVFVVNEFYQLDGQKVSTSRRHAIWLLDALDKPDVDVDHLRLFLCWTRPSVRETNFTWEAYAAVALATLRRWRSWLDGVARIAARPSASHGRPVTTPRPDRRAIALEVAARETRRRIDRWLRPEDFAPDAALRELDLLVHLADQDLADQDFESTVDETRVRAQLDVATTLAQMLWPIAPGMAAALWAALGHAGDVGSTAWEAAPRSAALDPRRLGSSWTPEVGSHVVGGAR